MKHLAVLLILVATLASAKPHPQPPPKPQPDADQSELIEGGHYTNKAGQDVHSPAHTKTGKPPAGASAQCRDGTYSFSRTHGGTCSGHHGVAVWVEVGP